MIRFNMQRRYTTIILMFVISTAVVLSTTLLVHFKRSSDALARQQEEMFSQELLKYMREQGGNLSKQLAHNLINPFYYFEMDTIESLLEVALAHPDVSSVFLFDKNGKIIHGNKDGGPITGVPAPLTENELSSVLGGESLFLGDSKTMMFLSPVAIGESVIGGVLLSMSSATVMKEIETVKQASIREEARTQSQLLSNAFVITLLFVLIGALFANYVARRLNQPIQELVRFAHKVGEGEFNLSTNIVRRDEIGELAKALNDMANRLNQRTEEIHFLAYHDSLTELPNRRYFREILDDAVMQGRRRQDVFAVLFIDLDNFKLVNDSQGHNVGDDVIRNVAMRISSSIRDEDHVINESERQDEQLMSRVGGDEFVILLKNLTSPMDAAIVAERILETVAQPLVVNDREIIIGTSIGIATFPENGTDSETLMRNADMAMYSAKAAGKNDYHYFSKEMDREAHYKHQMFTDLNHVLEKEELELWYQPQFNLVSNELVGAEALLRWNHPVKGYISPSEFIPIAEGRGLIHDIGAWVLQKASRQLSLWNKQKPDFYLSVNVSVAQLLRETLLQDLQTVQPLLGESVGNLHLEITETYLLKDERTACRTLEKIKSMGIQIWLDDFGTGYSALSHLKSYPVDGVKIDRTFVSDLEHAQDNRTLTQAIIALANAFGLGVVAEGVESEMQKQILRGYGCRLAQGYLLGRPMKANEFASLLEVER